MLCRDSMGVPYEITLELRCDGKPYGRVGERCGWQLARLAHGMTAARQDGDAHEAWPDPDDRFPGAADDGGELFAFRHRSRSIGMRGGELSCRLQTIRTWMPAQGHGHGEWRLMRRAFLEAWGSAGVGRRAVLTSGELGAFVADLVEEAEQRLGARYVGESAAVRAVCTEKQRNSNLIHEAGIAMRP
ncbi:hypothetical protein J5X84_39995 [Streptosporangiaceae bacterium NEAU-GS5]|nr:hypothetical protein [Streptosporangiaceae bacterium NEAU-GS5]